MDPITDTNRLTDAKANAASIVFSPQSLAWRVACFYGALFLVYGVNVTFMPLWFEARGLTPAQISIIVAAPFFVRCLITPAVAAEADRRRAHRTVIVVLSWLSLAIILLLQHLHGFWALLAPAVLLIVCVSTIMPLIETIAVAGVRASGLDYGRMRLWGSLTFIAASLGAGVAIDMTGIAVTVWLLALGAAATVAAGYVLPKSLASKHFETAAGSGPAGNRGGTRRLLASPEFRTFLIAAGAVQSAHALMLTLGAVHWQAQGYSGVWIGSFWLIAVAAEIAVFAYSRVIVERFGAIELIYGAALFSILRWFLMAFEPSTVVTIVLQTLHGITYGAAHLGAIHFIRDAVPEAYAGRGQALYATIASGLAHGAAVLISGLLFQHTGGLAYLAMAAIAVVSAAASFRLMRTWDRQPLELTG